MSGGFFDYEDRKLYVWANKIYNPSTKEEKELAQILRDIAEVLNAYDWWKSGDTSEEEFLRLWKEFKQKAEDEK